MEEGPEIPGGETGWWFSLGLLVVWLADKFWPKFKDWWQNRREDKVADARVEVKRAAAESRIRQDERDHIDHRYLLLIDTLQKQINELLQKQQDQEVKVEALRNEHTKCLESNAGLEATVSVLTARITKLEGEAPQ